MRLINIILADDHPIYRDGLEQALIRLGIAGTITHASSGVEVLDVLDRIVVDLIFMDAKMPQLNGLETTSLIRKKNTKIKIIIISMLEDKLSILQLFHAGINGFMHKNTDHRQLLHAIDWVMKDNILVPDEVSEYFNYEYIIPENFEESFNDPNKLSDREAEILLLICKQLSTKEIADKLSLTNKTVETHRNNIMVKTRAKNMVGLAFYAISKGYIKHKKKK